MRRIGVLPWVLLPILAFAIGLGACGKKADKTDSNAAPAADQVAANTNTNQTPETTQPPQTTPAPTPAPQPAKEPPKPERRHEPAPPPAPVTQDVTIAAGQALDVTLDRELTTKTDQSGTQFTTVTKEPIIIDGLTVIPIGSTVRGLVMTANRAPRLGGDADMTLEFNSVVLPDGRTMPISAEPLVFKGKSSTKGDIEKVVGGAVGGGILGGVLGGKKGALKGAAGGTVAGGVWAAATRGADLVIEQGREMKVTLTQPVSVSVEKKVRS